MTIHIALYKWKESVTLEQIEKVLKQVVAIGPKIPGLVEISAARNMSKYSEGYTHVIVVRGQNQVSLDTYRAHPDHTKIAKTIESMEEHGIGVDFETE